MTVIFYLFWIYLGFGKREDFEFFCRIRRENTVEKLPKKFLLASSQVFSRLKTNNLYDNAISHHIKHNKSFPDICFHFTEFLYSYYTVFHPASLEKN